MYNKKHYNLLSYVLKVMEMRTTLSSIQIYQCPVGYTQYY